MQDKFLFQLFNLPVDTNSAVQFPPLLGSNSFAVELTWHFFKTFPKVLIFFEYSQRYADYENEFWSVKYLQTILYTCIEEEGCAY